METTITKTPLQLAEDLRFKILLMASNMKYAKENIKGLDVELKANIVNVELNVLQHLANELKVKFVPADGNFNFAHIKYITDDCTVLIGSKEIN